MHGIAQKAKVEHHDFPGSTRALKKVFRSVGGHGP
jgi:hypothetical protein